MQTTSKDGAIPYSGTDNLEAMLEARNYNAYLLARVLRHARPGDRVVDFGAGNGQFAAEVKAASHDVLCVEADPDLCNRIRARSLEVVSSLADLAEGSVDYFFSLNVLEHIDDDVAALKAIRRCLKPGGRVYLYVPAFQLLYSSMDAKIGHRRRYRRGMLERTARAAGFTVTHSGYCDSVGFLAALVFKVIGNKQGDLSPSSVKVYDRLAFPVSRILDCGLAPFVGKNVEALLVK